MDVVHVIKLAFSLFVIGHRSIDVDVKRHIDKILPSASVRCIFILLDLGAAFMELPEERLSDPHRDGVSEEFGIGG